MMDNKIQTFVFFDLETTGFPNFKKTSITELCLHAILSSDLTPNHSNEEICKNVNKLNLCFNPKRLIDSEASKISGLDNYMLEHEKPFDENAGQLIVSFFQHLRQPICLVAHNGLRFDYPILKSSLFKLKMHLPDTIVCVDSLPAFRNIDSKKNEISLSSEIETDLLFNEFLNSEHEDVVAKEENRIANILFSANNNIPEFTYDIQSEVTEVTAIQNINETTPKRSVKHRQNVDNINLRKRSSDNGERKVFKSKKQLFQSETNIKNEKKTLSYKLCEIYKRLFNENPPISHHAEADVITLFKIANYYADDFVDYANKNAIPFVDIKSS